MYKRQPSVDVNDIPAEGETEPDVIRQTAEQTITVELPVNWTEDGQAIAYVTFELNDEVVEIHHPVETWHTGKHTLLLYYPIEHIIPNYTNTFNVYLRMNTGSADIEVGGIIASISGQAMAAAEAWDGTINLSDYIERIPVGGLAKTKKLSDCMTMEYAILKQQQISQVITGRRSIGAFGRPFVVEDNT